MKKIIYALCLILTLSLYPQTALAANSETASDIEFLNDGCYIITTIEDVNEGTDIIPRSTTTKSKTVKYYNANDEVMWYVKVTGTFTYGNGTSKCTSSSVTAASYASNWKITSKSASKSENTAIAKATAKQYFDGTVIKTINRTVKLSCSPTGVFS